MQASNKFLAWEHVLDYHGFLRCCLFLTKSEIFSVVSSCKSYKVNRISLMHVWSQDQFYVNQRTKVILLQVQVQYAGNHDLQIYNILCSSIFNNGWKRTWASWILLTKNSTFPLSFMGRMVDADFQWDWVLTELCGYFLWSAVQISSFHKYRNIHV